MTQARTRAVASLIIWGAAGAGFAAVFLGGGGPASYAADRGRIVAGAVLLGFVFLAHPLMLHLTRVRAGLPRVVVDERDESIDRRANAGALILGLMFVYCVCIALYEIYHDQGCVPVGWMWFLGYASVIFASLAKAAATLIIDMRMTHDGEG